MSPTPTLVRENFVDLTLSVHLKDGLLESLSFSEIFQVAGMFSPQLTADLMNRFITGRVMTQSGKCQVPCMANISGGQRGGMNRERNTAHEQLSFSHAAQVWEVSEMDPMQTCRIPQRWQVCSWHVLAVSGTI
jgi:hypothetical protein